MREKMVTLLYNATVKDNWFTFMSILSDFQIRQDMMQASK